MSRKSRYYKWMVGGRPIYGWGEYVLDGDWQRRVDGKLQACQRGYHICAADQVSEWCGTELWEVEPEFKGLHRLQSKTLCRTWKAVRKLKWSKRDMIAYIRWCVRRVRAIAQRDYSTDKIARWRWISEEAKTCLVTLRDPCTLNRVAGRAMLVMAHAADAAAHVAKGHRRAAYRAERLAQRRWIEQRIGVRL